MLTSRRTQAAWGDKRPAGGLSQPPGPHRHVHLLPPCPSPSCHQPQGEAGRQAEPCPENTPRNPACVQAASVTRHPAGPASLKPCQGLAPMPPAAPLPASKPTRPEGAGRLLYRCRLGPAPPGEGPIVPRPRGPRLARRHPGSGRQGHRAAQNPPAAAPASRKPNPSGR